MRMVESRVENRRAKHNRRFRNGHGQREFRNLAKTKKKRSCSILEAFGANLAGFERRKLVNIL